MCLFESDIQKTGREERVRKNKESGGKELNNKKREQDGLERG